MTDAPPPPSPPPPPVPNDPALLTDNQIQFIADKINELAPNSAACPICGRGKYEVATHLVSPTVFQPGGGLMIGGAGYPLVMLICNHCGHTRFHNAVLTKVINASGKIG